MIHRRFTIVTITAATVLAGGLVASAGAKGHQTECNGSFSNTTLHRVVVKSGDTCRLDHVTVLGGMRVTGGMFKVDNSTIRGGWRLTGGTGIPNASGRPVQCADTVDGGIRVMNASGGRFNFGETLEHCAGLKLNGGLVFVHNTHVNLDVDGALIHGRLLNTHNTGSWNEVEATTVTGAATCEHNNFVHGGTTAINDHDSGMPQTNHYHHNTGCPA